MEKISLLIVDDSDDGRYLMRRRIERAGLASEIFEADSGRAALDLFGDYDENREKHGEDFPPALIFLDINMPIMNGFEFLEEFAALREDKSALRETVVAMFTSSEEEGDIERSKDFDFVKGYFLKGSLTSKNIQEKILSCLQS